MGMAVMSEAGVCGVPGPDPPNLSPSCSYLRRPVPLSVRQEAPRASWPGDLQRAQSDVGEGPLPGTCEQPTSVPPGWRCREGEQGCGGCGAGWRNWEGEWPPASPGPTALTPRVEVPSVQGTRSQQPRQQASPNPSTRAPWAQPSVY